MNPLIFNQVSRHFYKLPRHLDFLKSTEDLYGLFDIPIQLSEERKKLFKRLYQGIGKTGCYTVKLPNNNLLRIKMEYSNSMGNSHYSRYWIPYLFIAESLGLITPNKTKIIEVTSGSAGIALAMVAKELGFHTTIIVPKVLPKNRIQPMMDYGAELVIVDGYIDRCVEKLKSLVKQNGYFPTNHSEEKSDFIINVFSRIAKEYLDVYDFPDYAIIGLGNGTTTYAIFSELKKRDYKTKCISYHPDLTKDQLIFGLYGPNVSLRHIELADALTDKKVFTNDIFMDEIDDYFKCDTEIKNLGPSSKYGIAIAYNIAKKVSNKTILTIGYDKNDRY
jgi:cysteine synthase